MKDKIWNFFGEPVFSFASIPIMVNEKNIKHIILSIDEAIIKAGFKYQIYELFPHQLFLDGEEIRLTYKADRLKNYWTDTRGENIYSILQIHQWYKYEKALDLEVSKYPTSLYYTMNASTLDKKYYSSNVKPLVKVYSNFFRFDKLREQNLEIMIESYSDIWFDRIIDLENTDNVKSNIDDSKLNAPRINSFLREIEKELAKYGSNLKKDLDGNIYNNYTTENRVLTAGEIVYVEDMN